MMDRWTDRQTQGEKQYVSQSSRGGDMITKFNLHNYEMLNKITNSTFGYNALDNDPVVSRGVIG